MSTTAEGLRFFGKVVRWISTILAVYALWFAWKATNSGDSLFVAMIAAAIFIAGNGIGWWVQVVAERNR